jgi:phage terminase large subunit-like protein
MDFALKLLEERPEVEPKFFFYHREAGAHDLTTDAGLKAAILEASGPYIAKWTDTDRIARRFRDADADPAYAERVWLNRRVQATAKAFDVEDWAACHQSGHTVPSGAGITLGFDGSRYDDATALVGTEIQTGYQWLLRLWERPETVEAWEVNVGEVDGIVTDAFDRWTVARMYCDPPKWESWVAAWAGRYGDKRVLEWWTNRRKPMAYAIRGFQGAVTAGELQHSGDRKLARHIGNCCRAYTNLMDEEEQKLWVLRKERPDSPHKIDAAMAAILSWEARTDAIAAGEGVTPEYAVHFL